MPLLALLLALGAACLHALWNLLLARSSDTHAATAVAMCASVVVFAPIAVATFDADVRALPWLAASSVLVLAYFAGLASAYRRADLSFIYPLARGGAPVIVLGVSGPLLAVPVSAGQILGIGLVATGIAMVRGIRSHGSAGDTLLALAIAGCIAGYTLVDKVGIRYASPLTYMELVMLLPTAAYLGVAGASRGVAALRAQVRPDVVIAGIAMFLAYTLVLAALSIAPAAPVAAVRETSVVMATAMAAIVLHERVRRSRSLGAIAVALGVALISAW